MINKSKVSVIICKLNLRNLLIEILCTLNLCFENTVNCCVLKLYCEVSYRICTTFFAYWKKSKH